MDKRTAYQDITIDDHVYRLRKVDARTGTWLYSVLSAKASPDGEPVTLQQLINAFHTCARSEFTQIQDEVLRRVSLIEEKDGKEFESTIVAPNGSGMFSFDFIDVTAVFQLTDMQVIFNVSPFFPEKPSSSA